MHSVQAVDVHTGMPQRCTDRPPECIGKAKAYLAQQRQSAQGTCVTGQQIKSQAV